MKVGQFEVVMAGLDPAIHASATTRGVRNRVDTRVKPAHDGFPLVPARTEDLVSPRTAAPLRGNDVTGR